MTPAARIAAAIEVLDEIERAPGPADAVLASYTRTRRYIGAKDRAEIADLVYRQFRTRARLDWCLRAAGAEPTPRLRVLTLLVAEGETTAQALADRLSMGRYAAAPLTQTESGLLERLAGAGLDRPDMPERVRLECPEWAEAELRRTLGDRFAEELTALRRAAPVDLRVNRLKAERTAVRAILAGEDVPSEPTPYAPSGLRLDRRRPVQATRAFRDGLVEVMDEGSQLLALLVGAAPGMRVVDFCAGAGGKTLALAAEMANKGQIVACDVEAARLERARRRLARAGVDIVECRPLSSERDKWVKRAAGRFDRVLIDAPCSGTGTWRRAPDARWTGIAPAIADLTALQDRILASARRLVKPGGRLVYGTCSLLAAENEDRVEALLAAEPGFRIVPARDLLPDVSGAGTYLRLSPATSGTDGFFGAVLERAAGGGPDSAQ